MVKAVAWLFHGSRDDLIGAGSVGLITGVDKWLALPGEHYPAKPDLKLFLYRCICYAMRMELRYEKSVSVPDSSIRARIAKPAVAVEYNDHAYSRETGIADADIRDFVEHLPTAMERAIVEWRLEGYDDVEIGELMGLHPSTVGRARLMIKVKDI